MKQGACRSCGQPILWVRTRATGKMMPLDAEPNQAGNVELVRNIKDPDGPRVAIVHARTQDPDLLDTTRYMPHHATCPEAHQYRRNKGGSR